MQLIATRRYLIADIEGRDYKATDILYRLDSGEYELDMRTDGLPGEADRIERIEPEYAFQWLTELPEQIEFSSARVRNGLALVLLSWPPGVELPKFSMRPADLGDGPVEDRLCAHIDGKPSGMR